MKRHPEDWFGFVVKGRKTTCIYRNPNFAKPFIGRAKCSPNDEFTFSKGQEISRLRALAKYYKKVLKDLDHWHEIHFNAAKAYKEEIFENEDIVLSIEDQIKEITGKKDEDEI